MYSEPLPVTPFPDSYRRSMVRGGLLINSHFPLSGRRSANPSAGSLRKRRKGAGLPAPLSESRSERIPRKRDRQAGIEADDCRYSHISSSSSLAVSSSSPSSTTGLDMAIFANAYISHMSDHSNMRNDRNACHNNRAAGGNLWKNFFISEPFEEKCSHMTIR